VKKLIDDYRVSIRRACAACLIARSLVYYKLQGPRDDRAVRQRIKEIATASRGFMFFCVEKAGGIITSGRGASIWKKD
jgi:hypothetical protein